MANSDSVSGAGELAPTRETLLERLRDLDDAGAWQQFFDTYWKLIYCAAVRSGLSRPEAEDVVQETMSGVARGMEGFRYQPEACSFKGWLMHITRRRIIDRLRKRQSEPPIELLPADTSTSTGGGEEQIPDAAAESAFTGLCDAEWEQNLMAAALERVKRKVPARHYQIFHLHGVKTMPAREVSELLGVSLAKVYVVRHRVARQVKRELRKLMEGP